MKTLFQAVCVEWYGLKMNAIDCYNNCAAFTTNMTTSCSSTTVKASMCNTPEAQY